MDTHKNTVKNGNRTVLVVEDSNLNMMLLEAMLRNFQSKVIFARDGQEALKILRSYPVDLVLSDIQMPWMNGFELLESIRARRQLRNIPVILMSAGGQISLTDEAIKRGANGFLTHPFSSFDLLQVIQPYGFSSI